MPKARLIYDGDGDYIEKDRRILQLKQEIQDKVDAIPWVVDDLTGTSSTDALSANMGRVLQEQINELSALWHFLSGWNASTWLPTTNPRVDPYYYKTWDYYRVTAIWETNYKPHWWTYNQWVASTAVELDDVSIWDWYMYDGWVRILIKQWWSWWEADVIIPVVSELPANPVNWQMVIDPFDDNYLKIYYRWRRYKIKALQTLN